MTEFLKLLPTKFGAKDIAIYVGGNFYTMESFTKEVAAIGACRRVNKVPDVQVGHSRVFLVYNDNGQNVYFGYYTINSIGYVVGPGVDMPKELEERGVTPISVSGPSAMPVRGCGQLVFGAMYLLSEDDLEKVKDLADKSDIEGSGMVLFDPPIPYFGKRFRGFRYVNGDELVEAALDGLSELIPVPAIGGRVQRYRPLDDFVDEPISSKHEQKPGGRKPGKKPEQTEFA